MRSRHDPADSRDICRLAPGDQDARRIAEQFVDHFHGAAFSGLIGGAVEIYVRSAGWKDSQDAPRPLPPRDASPYGIANAAITAIVPVLGIGMAGAVQGGAGPWHDYVRGIMALRHDSPDSVGVFPVRLSEGATAGTTLGQIFGSVQTIGASAGNISEKTAGIRCRDLAQGIAQLANGQQRLKVFVSHTKRAAENEGELLDALIKRIRCVIANTRLAEYFDASDLQPGSDWPGDLEERANERTPRGEDRPVRKPRVVPARDRNGKARGHAGRDPRRPDRR